ncbi:uncharacterized protein LOC115837052 [Nomascus leucogenys]|uniref:uncharacterized protein LOC115837052 n=1 Tax=Nomascus leucogenys TaxID=61853 RepID=UPI00122D9FF8|nr:uncharacterized protein LOC115837052 [Nomascus leucogenys]
MPSPELSRPGWGVGPGGGGWGPGLPARCELPNSGARRAGPRGEGVPRRDLGGGRPVSEWGRASPTPVRLPPTARPPSRLARRSSAPSSPSPGSRARGGAEKRIQESHPWPLHLHVFPAGTQPGKMHSYLYPQPLRGPSLNVMEQTSHLGLLPTNPHGQKWRLKPRKGTGLPQGHSQGSPKI